MPSNGDLFFGLKRKNIFPTDQHYADHIFKWIKENMFPNKYMSCEEKKWVKKFAPKFKALIKTHSGTSQTLEYGKSDAADRYLRKNIDIVTTACECSECVAAENPPENVEMVDVEEEKSEPTKRQIAYQSLKLRKEYGKEEIFHAFKQLIYERSIQILKYSVIVLSTFQKCTFTKN